MRKLETTRPINQSQSVFRGRRLHSVTRGLKLVFPSHPSPFSHRLAGRLRWALILPETQVIFYPLTKLFCFRSGAQTDSGSEAKFQPFLTAIRFATTKSHSARFYCMVPICLSISRSHTHAIVQTLLPTHTPSNYTQAHPHSLRYRSAGTKTNTVSGAAAAVRGTAVQIPVQRDSFLSLGKQSES